MNTAQIELPSTGGCRLVIGPNSVTPKSMITEKLCKYCNLTKSLSEFPVSGAKCKSCNKPYKDEQNRLRALDKQKWAEQNREKVRIQKQKYKTTHQEEIKQANRANPQLKFQKKSRANVRSLLIGNKEKFGITPGQFKSWIEYQFTDQMCFGNYGDYWNLDHVMPLSKFDLTDPQQFIIANNWTNIRPVITKDNEIKSCKVDQQVLKE